MSNEPQSQPASNNDIEGTGIPEPAVNRESRVSIWRVVGTVLSLALLIYLIWAQGWDEIMQVLESMPAHYFWIALGLTLLSRISVGLRWYTLLRSAGVKMSLWQSMRLTFMGLFASNFLPTTIGGDLVRIAGAVYLHVDAAVGAASLVVDRLVGMTGMASLAPFGLAIVLQPSAASEAAPQLALLPALARMPGVGWAYRKADAFARSLLRSSVYWLRRPLSLVWALLCTYGHMLFTFLAVWLLLRGMDQPLSFWWIGALWSLNYFVTTFLPISINGLGLQELTITSLYTQFGGVSMEAALALALFMRLLPALASLPGAAFLPDIMRPMPRLQQDAVQQSSDAHENAETKPGQNTL